MISQHTQELPLICRGNVGKSLEILDIAQALEIASRIVGIIPDKYLKYTVTHIVGYPEHGSEGFYIHSTNPSHSFLVQIQSIPISQIPREAHGVYINVNIECYVTRNEIVIYPIGMYPGCDIFKRFVDVFNILTEGKFVSSGLCENLKNYMFSYTKVLEFQTEHPEFYYR